MGRAPRYTGSSSSSSSASRSRGRHGGGPRPAGESSGDGAHPAQRRTRSGFLRSGSENQSSAESTAPHHMRRSLHHHQSTFNTKNFASHAPNKDLIVSVVKNLDPFLLLSLALTIGATWVFIRWDLEVSFQLSLLVSPIVFPLAFSISASYYRRNAILMAIAKFKANGMSLYYCHRDWADTTNLDPTHSEQLRFQVGLLMDAILAYCRCTHVGGRLRITRNIYRLFSALARMNDALRLSDLPGFGPLLSRVIHLHNVMAQSFEDLRIGREYQTPRAMRNFFKVFTVCFPILLAPYFVSVARTIDSEWPAYYLSVVTVIVFGSLQSVQDQLDDPFDGIGEDDIDFSSLEKWHHLALFHIPEKQQEQEESALPMSDPDQELPEYPPINEQEYALYQRCRERVQNAQRELANLNAKLISAHTTEAKELSSPKRGRPRRAPGMHPGPASASFGPAVFGGVGGNEQSPVRVEDEDDTSSSEEDTSSDEGSDSGRPVPTQDAAPDDGAEEEVGAGPNTFIASNGLVFHISEGSAPLDGTTAV